MENEEMSTMADQVFALELVSIQDLLKTGRDFQRDMISTRMRLFLVTLGYTIEYRELTDDYMVHCPRKAK